MKRSVLSVGLLSALIMAPVAGYSAKPETAARHGDPLPYKEVLERYYALISAGTDESDEAGEGEMGVLEAISGKESSDALESTGYAIRDISGDGIPELLIAAITKKDASGRHYGSQVHALYTVVNGQPALAFEGRARSGFHYTGQGNFFYQGSNGAMYSIFGTYSLLPDGSALSCKDYYFTYEKDGSPAEVGFYHNTSGEWNKAVSEELKIGNEEFWQINARLESRIRGMELIPFSDYPEYAASIASTAAAAAPVRVQWAEDVQAGLAEHDEFVADTNDAQARIVFSSASRVEHFRLLALTLDDVDENGKARFSTQELHALAALNPERPLVVRLTFFGSLPAYGISYVDPGGQTRRYALGMSGEDGSLLLIEF